MTTRVIEKALAVEQDLALGRGIVQQDRGGSTLDLQKISISKTVSDVSVFANDTTANEYVDPNLVTTVLVESYDTVGDEGGGIFYWDPSLNPLTADSGHIFASGIVTGAGAWRRLTQESLINVKHFGAKGDGVTDDSAAIDNAVTAAQGLLEAILYFPKGTYLTNLPIDLTAMDQVVVKGDGMQNTNIEYSGSSALFLFDTGNETDEDAQFVMMHDITLRTNRDDLNCIEFTSSALVSDITRSAYFTRILFIGTNAATGWKKCFYTQDVRGITVTDVYARHVNGSVGTIFWDIDNTVAFVAADYTAANNETHFYENDFGALAPSGGYSGGGGGGVPDNSVGLAQLAPGTAGNLITFDAAGDPVFVATGDDGQVLTSNGAGNEPTFQYPLPQEGTPIASATNVDLGAADSNFVDISGTTNIENLGSSLKRSHMWMRFQDTLDLVNSANLIVPGGANLTVEAGDIAEVQRLNDTADTWAIIGGLAANGGSLFGASGLVGIQAFTTSGTYNATAGTNKIMVICTGGGAGGRRITPSGGAGHGGTSSFGAFCSATGGIDGPSITEGGDGGTGTGGIVNISGGSGASSSTSAADAPGGQGGASFWGGGGKGGTAGNNGFNGFSFGSGGGGEGVSAGGNPGSGGGAGGTSIDLINSGFDGTSITIGAGGVGESGGVGGDGKAGIVVVFEFA